MEIPTTRPIPDGRHDSPQSLLVRRCSPRPVSDYFLSYVPKLNAFRSHVRVTDVTALWNTNAFWAYIVTVKLFKLHWEPRRLSAVLLATAGAMAVVYGGSTLPEAPDEPKAGSGHVKGITTYRPASALVGDVLTLLAAIVYGVYQVLYKMYATLPGDPEADLDGVDVPSQSAYESIPGDIDIEDDIQAAALSTEEDITYPPPFALFPNMLTSMIGVCTFLFLWIPMPIFQALGWTTYHFPADMKTVSAILGIALTGLVFNAGFMASITF